MIHANRSSHSFPSPAPQTTRGVRSIFSVSSVKFVALALSLVSAACSDAVTAPLPPGSFDGSAILPAITDARVRLVPAIQNVGVRDRVAYDMAEIEKALTARDAQRVRYHVRIAGGILIDYRAGLAGVVNDGPDVSGVALALYAVAIAAGGTFDIGALK
jgi:hypothetical protein